MAYLHPTQASADLTDYSSDEVERTYRKVFFKLIPFLFFCYIVSYIDRVNISFAKLQFMKDLGFSEAAYGFGAGLFFIGYVLFEVPSNLWMQRVGARITLLRIMVVWGLVSSAMMFVSTPLQFYVMRFILGVAEAGFFPGILFYLTGWFPAARRARVTGFFMMACAAAGIIGGPISGLIMTRLAGVYGLQGWQWLFLIEGLPSVLLGITAYFVLSDNPKEAHWLTDKERGLLLSELAADEKKKPKSAGHGLREAFTNPKIYIGALVYFAVLMPFNAIGFWTPTILKDLGVKSVMDIGLLSSLVFLAAGAGTYFVGKSSDKHMERRWHFAICGIVTTLCFVLLPLVGHNLVLSLLLLSVAAAASYGAFVVFWTIPQTFLSGKAMAGGLAMITSLGGIGGFVSPTVVGWLKNSTGSASYGLIGLGVVLLLGIVILFIALPADKNSVGVRS